MNKRTLAQECASGDNGKADPESPYYTAKKSNNLMAEEGWERNDD
jgi:hypothetical protein